MFPKIVGLYFVITWTTLSFFSHAQAIADIDAEQREELENMIRELEEENASLQAEYDRLRLKQTPGSTPDDGHGTRQPDCDMIAEAKMLRQHKGRLEARMQILEDHNRQLEAQLQRLRQLLDEVYRARIYENHHRPLFGFA